jgi:hypothetical protein
MLEFTISDVYARIALPSLAFKKTFSSVCIVPRAYWSLTSRVFQNGPSKLANSFFQV